MQERPAEGYDGVCGVDGNAREQGEVLAAVYVGAEMRSSRVGEEDKGKSGNMSGGCALVVFDGLDVDVGAGGTNTICTGSSICSRTYLSISLSCSTLKSSAQPTSMRICMPPSNSSSDCDAGEALCAPRRGVKLNMAAVASSFGICDARSPSA